MNFYKSKYEIRNDMEKYGDELKIFTDRLDIVKTKCSKEMTKKFLLDLIWDEVLKIYREHFSSVQEINIDDTDILKKEIILTLYGAAAHHTVECKSLIKWHGSVIKQDNKYAKFKAFSKDIWRPWLTKELLPLETTYSDGPIAEKRKFSVYGKTDQGETKIVRGELDVLPITEMKPKSSLNHLFCDYILNTVNARVESAYMGDDSISYKIYQPCPQLIYDILTNWGLCPLNGNHYYGMKLVTLNSFRKSILSSKNNIDYGIEECASKYLEYYMMEDFFSFNFAQSLINIINDRIVIRSNRDEEYTRNAMVLRYTKRIQDGTSQFLRNEIIRSYEKSDKYKLVVPDLNAYNILFGFTVPILEIVYSYFIGYILDENFQRKSFEKSPDNIQDYDEFIGNEDLFYSELLDTCKEYIIHYKNEYDLFFDYYRQPIIKDYSLKNKSIAVDINLTKSMYVIDDCLPCLLHFKTINSCLEALKNITYQFYDTNSIYSAEYYLRFPFNNIFSEFSYQKEMLKYNIIHITNEQRKVPDFSHVKWGCFWYSVPFEYVNSTVELRITNDTIDIYDQEGIWIANHVIRYNGDSLVTDIDHIPKGFDYRTRYQVNMILKNAKAIGSNTLRIIKLHLVTKKTVSKGEIIECNNILQLAKITKDKVKFEGACERALDLKTYLADDIKKLLF